MLQEGKWLERQHNIVKVPILAVPYVAIDQLISLIQINMHSCIREEFGLILSYMNILFSQHHLLKRLSFPKCVFLVPLLKIS